MLIDLNADLGEGGGNDAAIMPWITSANVCCGAHAGDAPTSRIALELARQHGVTVGAHPGYPDREHFGRQEWPGVSEDVIRKLILHQIEELQAIANTVCVRVAYVKPHGGLYNQAFRDANVAQGIIGAMRGGEYLVGLPGSALQELALAAGVNFIPEGFADRRYRPDGTLVPRDQADAFIHDPKEAVDQVERLIHSAGVRTICVHGDSPSAVEFVRTIRSHLLDRGHELRPFA